MKLHSLLYTVSVMLLSSAAIAQHTTVSGFVFEDKNNNGTKESTEKGLANVAVSNGKDVVLTDAKGQYTLNIANDNIVFVIKPTGYKVPLDEYNLPKSYALHKPQGTPAHFKFKGAQQSIDAQRSLDFGLVAQKEANDFAVYVFGDPQPYTMEDIQYFDKAIIQEAKSNNRIAFGISMGDLVGDNLDLHTPYKEVIKKMDMPWYNVMGNHDMNYDATADSLSDEAFEKNFGPANYAFNYGNAHFIVLDDILYPDPRDGKGYWGGFRPDQLAFIKNDLQHVSKDKLIVLNFHIPLLITGEDEFIHQDRQALFDLLEGYENVLAISAHTHLQRHNFYSIADGWRNRKPLHEYNVGTTSGDWYSGRINEQGVPASTMRDGTPKGYAVMQVKNNTYTLDYKVAGAPQDYQINIYAPKVLAKDKRTSASIFANFFMGTATDKVYCRIDNGDWKPMKYVVDVDPSFQAINMQYDQSPVLLDGRRPSMPEASTHLWMVNIPTKLIAGEHTIEVKATDMFGKTYTQKSTYKIVE